MYKKIEEMWWKIFSTLEKNNIFVYNFSTIIEYSLTLLKTNSSVERIFSITNDLWTDEKKNFNVETTIVLDRLLLQNRTLNTCS